MRCGFDRIIPIGLDGYRQGYRLLSSVRQGVAIVLIAAVVAWLPGVVSAQTLEILTARQSRPSVRSASTC